MTRNKLYSILGAACFFGYVWLGFSIYTNIGNPAGSVSICLFKNATSLPCPSCGTTRAIKLFLTGNVYESVMTNPFGLIVAFLMAAIPLWILFDLLLRKCTLFVWYLKTENVIRINWVATFLIAVVIINWIWNIYKL